MHRGSTAADEHKTREELMIELAELRSRAFEIEEMRKEFGRMDKIMRMAVVAAQEEKARTEAVIAALGDGVSIQDTDFRVLFQNAAHKGMAGYHVGERCYRAYRSLDRVCEGCHLALSFRDGGNHRAEELRTDGNGERHYEIISSPLRNSQGDIVAGIEVVRDITDRKAADAEREKLIARLQDALAAAKTLKGLLPICSSCKKIRDEKGYWLQVEEYIRTRSEAEFSHSVCPDCIEKLYPEYSRRRK